MIGPLLLSLALAAAGEPPEVHYLTKLETRAWEPIALAELTPVVEAAAVAPLSKLAAMRMSKTGFADLESGDYAILIQGRFIEEAERFAIYVGFQKGKKDDLPSFHVAEGVELSGASKAEILKRIEAAGRRAGARLAELLGPRLEAVRLSVGAPPVEDPTLPWQWGAIEVPTALAPTKAMKELLDVTNPDHVRHKALTEIEGHVFDQKAAKNVMERVLLTDPLPAIRARAAEALAPVARTSAPTQSILLYALRTEVEEEVLGPLTQLSSTFVGLSRKEAIESWLELVSSDATPPTAAGKAADLLSAEEDVQNLEIAVSICLGQEALIYGKKSACASRLLRKIPEPRRLSVAWRYLTSARTFDQGGSNVLDEVLDDVAGRSSKPISPELADLLLSIGARPSAGAARRKVLYPLRRHPAPNAAAIERLIPLVREPELAVDALRVLVEWADDHPELAGPTAGALERLRVDVSYLPKPSHQNPYEELDKTIERLRGGRR